MIVTFYSYKGGVGRTQTVANMATYLAFYHAQKVLLIDWDLEAPGLDFYFPQFEREKVEGGLIEMLVSYTDKIRSGKELDENKVIEICKNLTINNIPISTENKGKIDFVTAGKYDNNYISKINAFRWDDFYENLDGRTFLEIWKQELKKQYDWILIDSRTGENDYSGICNILMPDRNVFIIAPNRQNVEGTYKMAKKIQDSPYTKQGFRKPIVFPVLSRVERDSPDFEGFMEYFKKRFLPILEAGDLNINTDIYFNETYIRYNKYLAINERVSISQKGSISSDSFEKVYEVLYEYLVDNRREANEQALIVSNQEIRRRIFEYIDASDFVGAFEALDALPIKNKAILNLLKREFIASDNLSNISIQSYISRLKLFVMMEFGNSK